MSILSIYKVANSRVNKLGNLDKVIHVAIGAGITVALIRYAHLHPLLAVAATSSVGYGKERLDKNFNMLDLVSWIVSAIVGLVIGMLVW